jgi:hypothetical protein
MPTIAIKRPMSSSNYKLNLTLTSYPNVEKMTVDLNYKQIKMNSVFTAY